MSFSRWSDDCVALVLTKEYFEGFLKDLRELSPEDIEDEDQRTVFECYDAEDFEDVTCDDIDECIAQEWIADEIKYKDGGKNSENYSEIFKYDLETGEFKKDVNGYNITKVFNGFIYPLSYGSESLYEPEYKNKEAILRQIKKELYIPRGYDIENNIVFYTGVEQG
jgi:hypothetical protein